MAFTLFSIYTILEHKTYERNTATFDNIQLAGEEEEELVVTQIIKPVKPPPKTTEIIRVVEDSNDIIETVIESTEIDERDDVEATPVLDADNISEYGEEEEIIEDVPFAIIENAPVFPVCKGNNEELRACFSKEIAKHINKKFNVTLAEDLALTPGKKRFFVIFTINSKGIVSDIKTKAPHPPITKRSQKSY